MTEKGKTSIRLIHKSTLASFGNDAKHSFRPEIVKGDNSEGANNDKEIAYRKGQTKLD